MNAKETVMAGINDFEIRNATLDTKRTHQRLRKKEITDGVAQVAAAAKAIDASKLDGWDKHALKLAADIAHKNEADELEQSLRRLLKLSGTNYAIERSHYYSRRSAQHKLGDD